MKNLRLLINLASVVVFGMTVWLVCGDRCDTRRFLRAEERFYFNLREGEDFLRRNIRSYEGCTPEQADSVFDYLCREGWIALTDELCSDAARYLDSMKKCCPRRFIPRLAACIRAYDRLDGLIWWTQIEACYRVTPRGFALSVLPHREYLQRQAGCW